MAARARWPGARVGSLASRVASGRLVDVIFPRLDGLIVYSITGRVTCACAVGVAGAVDRTVHCRGVCNLTTR